MDQSHKGRRFWLLVALSIGLVSCRGQNTSSSSSTSSSTNVSSSSSSSSSSSGESYSSYPTYDEDSIRIHYKRDDRKFDGWALWLWGKGAEGKEYTFNGTDEFGGVASYKLTTLGLTKTSTLGLIVKSKGSWDAKDPDGDRFVSLSSFTQASDKSYNIYLVSGDSKIYTTPDLQIEQKIESSEFADETSITLTASDYFNNAKVFADDTQILNKDFTAAPKACTLILPDTAKADFNKTYKVQVTFASSGKVAESGVSVRGLYKTDNFASTYNYDGELGAIYTSAKTTFKVWSPVSTAIKVRVYANGTPKSVSQTLGDDTISKEIDLTKGEKGVFSGEIDEDLAGKYYTYVVTNSSNKAKEIVDPYAKSTGVNGLRGMIVDFSKTNPTGWDQTVVHPYDRKQLAVYETHIADLTSSTTWTSDTEARKSEKLFNGACLSGTTYTKDGTTVKTGFDHIKELGVNAVQLLPIFDSANDEVNKTFNWGYNPLNYNSLDGSFASDPYDGYVKIKEFKNLVQKYNEAGINIIMDVVYNHVNGWQGSNFDVLMPYYYFRYNSDGTASNGSGCGNETASDMYMFRKFMIDSTTFWAKEYKLGGFRFDLMGLHDLTTMNELTAKCKEINPNICIYGEPWTGGDSPLDSAESAKQANGNDYEGYGQFNDHMRDNLIAGGLNSATTKAWATDSSALHESSSIQMGLKGTTLVGGANTIKDPDKTTNYVTCHDNYTLYDRIVASGTTDESVIRKMAVLANSVVFTSQGTSFMLAGEEFLRTKNGNSNSYNASYALNALDYSLKVKNLDMFKTYQKLISLKENFAGLHLAKTEANKLDIQLPKGNELMYDLSDAASNKTYRIVHVSGYNVSTDQTADFAGYTLYLDTLNPSTPLTLSATTKLSPYQTIIAYKNITA